MSEWISVEDRLPEYADDILLINKNSTAFAAGICRINNGYAEAECPQCGKRFDIEIFTHWMPLPPPPVDK